MTRSSLISILICAVGMLGAGASAVSASTHGFRIAWTMVTALNAFALGAFVREWQL